MPCEFCNQLGYKGRMGVFEMLRIDGEAKKAILQDPGPATVRNLLRAQKMPTLNEAALRAVVAGKTDLGEIQRVMNPPAGGAGASAGGGGGPPAPKRGGGGPPAPKRATSAKSAPKAPAA